MTHIHTYKHPCPSLVSRAQTHIYLGARILLALSGLLPLHTQTSSYLLEIWSMMTDTHTHTHTPMPTVDSLHKNTHSSFMLTGAFPLLARNLRTYFTSVGRVFFVETVVLQTVLLDIRAWSCRFLVIVLLYGNTKFQKVAVQAFTLISKGYTAKM